MGLLRDCTTSPVVRFTALVLSVVHSSGVLPTLRSVVSERSHPCWRHNNPLTGQISPSEALYYCQLAAFSQVFTPNSAQLSQCVKTA